MKKVRIVHFWIGVIVSLFLLIESITGIILYFDKGNEGPKFSMQSQLPSEQTNGNVNADPQNGQTSGNESTGQTSQTDSNNQFTFPNGGRNFGNKPEQSAFSVKSLHTGIIGLISGIGLLILTGTGLVLSWILWNNKRKAKKKKQKVAMAI